MSLPPEAKGEVVQDRRGGKVPTVNSSDLEGETRVGNLLDHAKSSAAKLGGVPEDYYRIHEFIDSSKLFLPDWRHRALLHSTFGIFLAERYVFGPT